MHRERSRRAGIGTVVPCGREARWRGLGRGLGMAAARQRHLARAAADEARLIMVSGELGLRHAADLTHAAAEKKPQAIFTHAAREVPLRVELLSYAASMVAAAALIAVALLVIGSRGGVMPLLH